jgi:hypothetical protein
MQAAASYRQHIGPLVVLFALFATISLVLREIISLTVAIGGPIRVLLVVEALFLGVVINWVILEIVFRAGRAFGPAAVRSLPALRSPGATGVAACAILARDGFAVLLALTVVCWGTQWWPATGVFGLMTATVFLVGMVLAFSGGLMFGAWQETPAPRERTVAAYPIRHPAPSPPQVDTGTDHEAAA